jgi:hypothetical protein
MLRFYQDAIGGKAAGAGSEYARKGKEDLDCVERLDRWKQPRRKTSENTLECSLFCFPIWQTYITRKAFWVELAPLSFALLVSFHWLYQSQLRDQMHCIIVVQACWCQIYKKGSIGSSIRHW